MIASAVGLTLTGIIYALDEQIDIAFFLTTIMQIFQAALAITGMVTIIFILISKFVPLIQSDIKDTDWSVDMLEHSPQKNDRIKISEVIIESFF